MVWLQVCGRYLRGDITGFTTTGVRNIPESITERFPEGSYSLLPEQVVHPPPSCFSLPISGDNLKFLRGMNPLTLSLKASELGFGNARHRNG